MLDLFCGEPTDRADQTASWAAVFSFRLRGDSTRLVAGAENRPVGRTMRHGPASKHSIDNPWSQFQGSRYERPPVCIDDRLCHLQRIYRSVKAL